MGHPLRDEGAHLPAAARERDQRAPRTTAARRLHGRALAPRRQRQHPHGELLCGMVHVEGAAAIGLLPQRAVRGADQSREGTPERRDEERGPKPRQVRHRHHASDEGSNEPPVLNDAKRGDGLAEATLARRGAPPYGEGPDVALLGDQRQRDDMALQDVARRQREGHEVQS